MSEKKFMSYGDAETIFTGYANEIKDKLTYTEWSGTQAEYDAAILAGTIDNGTIVTITDAPSPSESSRMTYNDNGILGAKNLLPNNATSQTINDVTFTVNDDGTVIANGQASANAPLVVWDDLLHLEEGSYIFTGCPAGGSDATYSMMVQDEPYTTTKFETGNGLVLDVPAGGKDYHFYYARIVSGYNAQNLVFKPMLRLASDTDSTYKPYAMTNRELTEAATDKWITISSASDNLDFIGKVIEQLPILKKGERIHGFAEWAGTDVFRMEAYSGNGTTLRVLLWKGNVFLTASGTGGNSTPSAAYSYSGNSLT